MSLPRRPRLIIGASAALLSVAVIAYALEPPQGYGARIDYAAVIGPPPAPGSAADNADRDAFARTTATIATPAWATAKTQIFATSPAVTDQLGCAIGRRLRPETTPLTLKLLTRAGSDLRAPVEAAKAFYQRNRPYVGAADSRTCDPRTLGSLGTGSGGALNYAWPSGHAAYGELWGRILADALPSRAGPALAWGRGLGDNRVTCRVHWPSDVAAGRKLGDALYAELARAPDFRADLAAARAELAKAPPATRCAAR